MRISLYCGFFFARHIKFWRVCCRYSLPRRQKINFFRAFDRPASFICTFANKWVSLKNACSKLTQYKKPFIFIRIPAHCLTNHVFVFIMTSELVYCQLACGNSDGAKILTSDLTDQIKFFFVKHDLDLTLGQSAWVIYKSFSDFHYWK